jgi:hypothetical protein
MVHIKTYVPKQSGIPEGGITDDNDIVRYNHPYIPTQSEVRPLPDYPINLLSMLMSALSDAQSYHGASQGGSVSGVRSDAHAQNLQEQDLMPLSVIDEIMRVSYERLGEKVLAIVAEKVDTERLISYIGEDKRRVVMRFKREMLGNVRKVKVRLDNTYIRNKAASTNNIIQAAQLGLIVDQYGQPDRERVLRGMEFALPDELFRDLQNQTNRQYYEIEQMMMGEPTEALPWQNHKMHLDVLQDFMNGEEFMETFDRAMRQDEEAANIVRMFTQHQQAHSAAMSQAMGMVSPKQPQPAPQQQSQQSPQSQQSQSPKQPNGSQAPTNPGRPAQAPTPASS